MSVKCATWQVLLVLFREVLVWAIIILGKRIPSASLTPDDFGSLSVWVFLGLDLDVGLAVCWTGGEVQGYPRIDPALCGAGNAGKWDKRALVLPCELLNCRQGQQSTGKSGQTG